MLDTKEAAVYLRVAAVTLRRWRVEGIGPRYSKRGRFVRYRKVDLDKWLEQHLVGEARYDHAAPRKRGRAS